ncbi:serine/threonine-protein kinase [Streptomyces sp. NPDC052114]|uniref:serine/threonine-protein kinase n=1 Tax=unclassified Streptomyces TaxID=2593676 RepID=UPI003426EFB3
MERLTANDPAEVGRYRSIAELGRGGMGRVLLSSAPDGSLVALKQVRTQFVEDDGFRARFRREVAASRKVSGAHTSAVIDADADAEEPWLTSEFVPGPSLQEAVAAVGTLPEEAVLRMAAGLAAALSDIHRAGLVHRDLKPSNVLLTDDGPRVIDFGIARATEDGTGTGPTHSGVLVGSPGFMSPEQAEGRTVGPASDVFSLGTVLVMACTGTCPFIGPSLPQTLYNIVHTEPDLGALPAKVRPLVARCLAKDPAERPSPARLLEDIGRITRPARPWPTEVHELIAAQQAEIARLQEELERRTRERDAVERALVEGPPGTGGPDGPTAAPQPPRPRFAVLAGTAVVVATLTAAAVVALAPGGESDTRTTDKPPRATAPVERTAEQPSPEPATEAPPAAEATTPDTEPSAESEPTRQPPTRIETRPSTRPAAIADCGGQPLSRPATLIVACGDGGGGLKSLTWSGWGSPVARATGYGWQRICSPSCAEGREAQYSVNVTVSGLNGGRYTTMRVTAPQSPSKTVTDYSLDAYGPTQRG